MESQVYKLTYKLDDGRVAEPEYWFDYIVTNRESENIDLVIRLNDPDSSQPFEINTSVKKEFMKQPKEELDKFVLGELDLYY